MRPSVIPSAIIKTIIEILNRGGVGIFPTDTLYGIVGKALKRKTVERIYGLRRRNLKKPMIILIGDISDLRLFGAALDARTKKILRQVWPGKVSVVLPLGMGRKALIKKFNYLHRGAKSLAFRLPRPKWLRALLRETGPLVAPSANPEGEPPARTVKQAERYFGDQVQFYVDIGRLVSGPSTLVALVDRKIKLLRRGAGRIGGVI